MLLYRVIINWMYGLLKPVNCDVAAFVLSCSDSILDVELHANYLLVLFARFKIIHWFGHRD